LKKYSKKGREKQNFQSSLEKQRRAKKIWKFIISVHKLFWFCKSSALENSRDFDCIEKGRERNLQRTRKEKSLCTSLKETKN
jgi:hypothetical protein